MKKLKKRQIEKYLSDNASGVSVYCDRTGFGEVLYYAVKDGVRVDLGYVVDEVTLANKIEAYSL